MMKGNSSTLAGAGCFHARVDERESEWNDNSIWHTVRRRNFGEMKAERFVEEARKL